LASDRSPTPEPEHTWVDLDARHTQRMAAPLLLKAKARLGHSDPATTLRHYSHAIPLDDTNVADELDRLPDDLAHTTVHSE